MGVVLHHTQGEAYGIMPRQFSVIPRTSIDSLTSCSGRMIAQWIQIMVGPSGIEPELIGYEPTTLPLS